VLALDPGGLAPFGPLKWALVPTLVLAGLALLRPAWPRLWAPFLVAVGLAAAAGVDPLSAWMGTPERHFGAFTWLLCAAAFACGQRLDPVGRRLLLRSGAVTACVLGAWTGAEAMGWRPLDLAGAGTRPVGTLGSSAFVGAAAVLLGPLVVALPRRARFPAGGLALGALVVSGARAAWVGALVVAAAVVVLRRPKPALVAGAAAFAVAVALASGATARLGDTLSEGDGGARGRLDEWRVAARVVAHHPVLGLGPEGYRIDFGRHVDDGYEQAHGRQVLPDRAHSAVLDVAATTGLVGLAAYLGLLAVVGRALLRALRRADGISAAVAAGVLAYWVQSLFLFPVAELEPVAWLLAGTVVAIAPTRKRLPAGMAMAAAALALVALAAGVLDVAADQATRRALDTADASQAQRARRLRPDQLRYRLAAARTYEDGGDLRLAVVALDRRSPDPKSASERSRLLLELARQTLDGHDLRAARAALEANARGDSRNAEVLLRLGVVRALDGDQRGAEQAWLRAEQLAPRSAAAATDLALAYAQAGRWDEAKAAARRALAVDPGSQRARDVLEGGPDGT
jgi:O-antigen ligase